jgi:hypothetical protein
MFGLKSGESEYKETKKERKKKDEEDVCGLAEQLNRFQVFDQNVDQLINIST